MTNAQKSWKINDTLFSDGGVFEIQSINHKTQHITLINCVTHKAASTTLDLVKHLKKRK